jgi:Ca2+-binding EF-hand superfamily protein
MKITMCNKSMLALAVSGLMLSFGASANDDKMKKMDANNDGRISAAEHAAGARSMFQKMDSNSDGRVTAAEMDASHKQMKGDDRGGKTKSSDKLKSLDANSDGVITAAEHEAGSRSKFSQMDTDGDGYLSAAEMQAGHARTMGDQTRAPVR